MTAFLPWAAIGLAVAGAVPDARQTRFVPAAERLPKLLALYRQYGLPLPPRDAILVRQPIRIGAPGHERPTHWFTFLVASTDLRRPVTTMSVLLGANHPTPSSRYQAPAPDPTAIPNEEPWFDFPLVAVQAYALGHTALAEALLTRFDLAVPTTAEEVIDSTAWWYWSVRIGDPGSDWSQIARRLRLVLATQPEFLEESDLHLLYSLELGAASHRARPGSVDALFDDLVERGAGPDPGMGVGHLRRLAVLGFEAVQVALAHLLDERLTRQRAFRGFGCLAPPANHYMRVADVAGDLLAELADEPVRTEQELLPGPGRVDPVKARKWWEKARAEGEEAYLVRTVLPKQADATFANHVTLTMLAQRHPRRLSEVNRRVIETRPKMVWWPVVYLTATSALPDEERRKLLLDTFAKANPTRYAEALVQSQPTGCERDWRHLP